MKKELIEKLQKSFEDCAHKTGEGVEFWLARELQGLLDYSQWRRFEEVIERAKTACANAGQGVDDHFADVGKMVEVKNGVRFSFELAGSEPDPDHRRALYFNPRSLIFARNAVAQGQEAVLSQAWEKVWLERERGRERAASPKARVRSEIGPECSEVFVSRTQASRWPRKRMCSR